MRQKVGMADTPMKHVRRLAVFALPQRVHTHFITMLGYCNENDEVVRLASNQSECWEQCQIVGWNFVEFYERDCYCHKECSCIDDVKNNGRTTLSPVGYIFLDKC